MDLSLSLYAMCHAQVEQRLECDPCHPLRHCGFMSGASSTEKPSGRKGQCVGQNLKLYVMAMTTTHVLMLWSLTIGRGSERGDQGG